MTRHLPALLAAAALAAVTSPALGQSVPPPVVTGQAAAGAPFANSAGQAVYQDAPVPYPAAASVQGGWVWHGEGGPAAGAPYSHGPYAPGNWVWDGEGGAVAGYGATGYNYASGGSANPCGCPGAVNWVRVPVQTSYSYSPAVRHDKQVVEVHTVNDVVVEHKTVPAQRTTKYVKISAPKVTKVNKTK